VIPRCVFEKLAFLSGWVLRSRLRAQQPACGYQLSSPLQPGRLKLAAPPEPLHTAGARSDGKSF